MSDINDTTTPKKDTRTLAMGLAAAAAVCLIYAAFTQSWLVNAGRYTEYGFGLRGNHECSVSYLSRGTDDAKQECHGTSNSALIEKMRAMGPETRKYASAAFAPVGLATFVIILLAAVGLLAAAGLAAARKQPELPIAPTTVGLLGLMVGLITGCVFVATKPGPPGMVGVGMSFWLFGVGCVMGIVAAQMLAKVNRPPDREWTE